MVHPSTCSRIWRTRSHLKSKFSSYYTLHSFLYSIVYTIRLFTGTNWSLIQWILSFGCNACGFSGFCGFDQRAGHPSQDNSKGPWTKLTSWHDTYHGSIMDSTGSYLGPITDPTMDPSWIHPTMGPLWIHHAWTHRGTMAPYKKVSMHSLSSLVPRWVQDGSMRDLVISCSINAVPCGAAPTQVDSSWPPCIQSSFLGCSSWRCWESLIIAPRFCVIIIFLIFSMIWFAHSRSRCCHSVWL